ncbi:hypothetical protein HUG10_19595 (plasmid) [Halorarum halophilum]|uniref:DUF7344 domain-containing protein n=1 Tax=Halorarum halophilum TaxID=2743090 RepID=A0A7D5KYE8_9EURY|nr:hypothetical protein [Halobaculum halophilum]QLG29818.1 hypothetical protein HUG10_19595 [Halobaculum halophilum]
MSDYEQPGERGNVQCDVDEFIRQVNPPPRDVLDMEFVYEALAHSRRRYLIYSLLSSTRWSLDDLATKLVAWERDSSEAEVAPLHRDEMYVSLFHVHIPKLVELDILAFEAGDEEVIRAAENVPQVLAVLEGAGASLDAAQELHARQDDSEE